MSEAIKNRHDFVFMFEVHDGNPNGDPDQLNSPRIDPEDQHGLVTDVCIKRKIRNYIMLKKNLKHPYDIFIRQREFIDGDSYLNAIISKAVGETLPERQRYLCEKYWDIRTFGAVLSTGEKEDIKEVTEEDITVSDNAPKTKKKSGKKQGKNRSSGTVRGPVQLTFARSVDRVYPMEHSITRCCVTTEGEAEKQKDTREFASTFGKKMTIPYAIYVMHGFVSAHDANKTGFTEADLLLLWESLVNAFENDRASARGEINPVKLVIFKHANVLGDELSGRLFSRVKVTLKTELPRQKEDYIISVDREGLSKDITVKEWPEEKIY
jgi:CRISPR-associated protein Csd2